jgi:hypothetical protein
LEKAIVHGIAAIPKGTDSSYLFATYSPYGVFRSTDNGATWDHANNGLPFNQYGGCNFSALAVWDTCIYAGGYADGLYRSTNNGERWSYCNLPGDVRAIMGLRAQSGGSMLFAGVDGPDGVFRSTDDGANWVWAGSGLKTSPYVVNLILYDFAACSNGMGDSCIFAATFNGLFASTNGGTIWTKTSLNPPGGYPYAVALAQSRDDAGVAKLFAGTYDHGVYLSTDFGKNWTSVNSGCPVWVVQSLFVYGQYLIAGMGGSTIWRRPLADLLTSVRSGSGELAHGFELNQNHPNPFNPSTTIRYGLPDRLHVTLTVFNTLGQQVTRLENGEQEAGYHEVKFDGSRLSSGVYFYRMEAGSFVQTRTLLLVR